MSEDGHVGVRRPHVEANVARLRVYVEAGLAAGGRIELDARAQHYLRHVMRAKTGETLILFNGRDGEWRASLALTGKARADAVLAECLRPQAPEPGPWLLAAALKRAPMDWLAEKACELGAALLWPLSTKRTVVDRVNVGRLRAIAIEAAEQCLRLAVTEIREPVSLDAALASWPKGRRLIICDETGASPPIAAALAGLDARPESLAILTGPEGGFEPAELDALRKLSFVMTVGLGPRLLRAETAAIAALAAVQMFAGARHA
jgi:16S rRNA (uracil1498-N3)-methyltransferase